MPNAPSHLLHIGNKGETRNISCLQCAHHARCTPVRRHLHSRLLNAETWRQVWEKERYGIP